MSTLGTLEYIYTPASDIDSSIHFYQKVLGGALLWKIRDGDTAVACVRLSEEKPLILLANHLKKNEPILIYKVEDIESTAASLKERGGQFESGPFQLPQGP